MLYQCPVHHEENLETIRKCFIPIRNHHQYAHAPHQNWKANPESKWFHGLWMVGWHVWLTRGQILHRFYCSTKLSIYAFTCSCTHTSIHQLIASSLLIGIPCGSLSIHKYSILENCDWHGRMHSLLHIHVLCLSQNRPHKKRFVELAQLAGWQYTVSYCIGRW